MPDKTSTTAWFWVTSSQRVCVTPVILLDLVLTGDAVGEADATIYDGAGTSGEICLVIRALDNDSKQLSFRKGLILNKGLYVAIGTNVTGVLVHYLPFAE